MIEKYLKTLLVTNKRVIIPDFGGFVVKRTASGDVISFNNFLKFNDDLLLKAVMSGEKIEKVEAFKQIRLEMDAIKTGLDEKGAYHLKGLGYLVRDRKMNIRFVDHLDDPSILGEEEKVAQEETNEDTQEMKNENAPKMIFESKLKQFVKKQSLWFWVIIAASLLVLIAAWFLFLRPKESNEIIVEKHAEIVEEKADSVMSGEEKTSVWKRLAAAFSKKEGEKASDDSSVVSRDYESVMAPFQVDTVHGVYVVADKNISPKGRERYHVIIGSFSEKKNARSFKSALIDDGYGAEVFDRYNGFEAVSIGGYPSLDIALRVSGESLEKYPDLWILVK